MSRFRYVNVKAELVNEIEAFIERTKTYRSIAEFVSEAVRLRLQELQPKEASSVG